jgi:hypothetical protein
MNETIRELAVEAGLKSASEEAVSPQELKFALSIIEKCVLAVEENFVGAVGSHASAHNSAVAKCKQSIL